MASVSQTAIASTTTDGASATFSAQAIGANGGSDILYVGAGARSTANASTMSCTIDGVAATQVVFHTFDEGGNVRSNCGIFALARNSLPDPAQTDVDVVITHNATCIRHAAAVAVSPDASATAGDTASQGNASTDLSVDTTTSGIVLGFIYNGDAGTINWTGLTETSDLDVAAEGSNRFGSAYASNVTAETPRTVTAAVVTDLSAKVAAAFPVAAAAAGRPVVGRDLINSRFIAPRALVN
jgi:hypothetical protein